MNFVVRNCIVRMLKMIKEAGNDKDKQLTSMDSFTKHIHYDSLSEAMKIFDEVEQE